MCSIRATMGVVLVAMTLPCYTAEPNAPAEAADLDKLLREAVQADNRDQVESHIDKGANVNSGDERG